MKELEEMVDAKGKARRKLQEEFDSFRTTRAEGETSNHERPDELSTQNRLERFQLSTLTLVDREEPTSRSDS